MDILCCVVFGDGSISSDVLEGPLNDTIANIQLPKWQFINSEKSRGSIRNWWYNLNKIKHDNIVFIPNGYSV